LFSWEVEIENVFQYLKVSSTTTPLLIHSNPSKPFVFEIDAFDFRLGSVLSQPRDGDLLHLVHFRSCKFFPAKINYEIHDKKLLAIVDVFKEWHHLLEGVQHEIIVYSDHKNL
jgi:hypothetical protein